MFTKRPFIYVRGLTLLNFILAVECRAVGYPHSLRALYSLKFLAVCVDLCRVSVWVYINLKLLLLAMLKNVLSNLATASYNTICMICKDYFKKD